MITLTSYWHYTTKISYFTLILLSKYLLVPKYKNNNYFRNKFKISEEINCDLQNMNYTIQMLNYFSVSSIPAKVAGNS